MNKIMKNHQIFIILSFFLPLITISQTTPLMKPYTYMPNQRFIQTGSAEVSLNNGSASTLTYTISFIKAQSNTSYQAGLTISKMCFQYQSGRYFQFNMSQNSRSNSDLTVNFTSRYMSKFSSLSIRYILVCANWGKFDSFYFYQQGNIQLEYTSSNNRAYSFLKTITSNFTISANRLYYSFVGLDIYSTYTNSFSIRLNIYKISANQYQIYFYVYYYNKLYLYAYGIHIFGFNNDDLTTLSPQVQFDQKYQSISTNSPSTINDNFKIFRQYNIIIGLQEFQTTTSLFYWSAYIISNVSINFSTLNTMSYSYFRIKWGLILMKECQDIYPYLHIAYNMCYSECPAGYYPDLINFRCLYCNDVMLYCSLCNNATICSKCYSGHPVIGGCSNVPGCSKINNRGKCIACDNSTFYYQNNSCFCIAGKLITGNCISIKQCTSTGVIAKDVVCIGCSTDKGFILKKGLCQCRDGYGQITGMSQEPCLQICGDGRIFQDKCDDNNTISGDGCSSSCYIEDKYLCSGGSKFSITSCRYNGGDISLTLIKTVKNPNQNQGIFTFQFSPVISNLQKMNFSNYLHFDLDQNMSLAQLSYDKGIITIRIDYTSDLQGKLGHLSLTFDTTLIIQKKIDIKFKIRSDGVKLIILTNQETTNLFELILLIQVVCIIVLFLIGSAVHKTIGVQIIQPYIIIIVLYGLYADFTENLRIYHILTVATGNVFYFDNKEDNLVFNNNNTIFNGRNYSISLLLMAGLIFLSLCVLCYFRYKTKQSKINNNIVSQDYLKCNKFLIKLYNSTIFPLSMGYFIFFRLVIHTLAYGSQINYERLIQQIPINSISHFIIQITCISVFSFQWGAIFINKVSNQLSFYGHYSCKYWYIPLLLTINFVVASAVALSYFDYISKPIQVITAILVVGELITLFERPYYNIWHNIGRFFNSSLSIFFGAWLIMRNFIPKLNDIQLQTIFNYIFLSLFGFNILINVLRILFQIKRNPETITHTQNKILIKNKKTQNQFMREQNILKQKYFKNINKLCVHSIQLNQKFEEQLNTNLQRWRRNMKPLKFDNSLQNIEDVHRFRGQKVIDAGQNKFHDLKEKMIKSFRKERDQQPHDFS